MLRILYPSKWKDIMEFWYWWKMVLCFYTVGFILTIWAWIPFWHFQDHRGSVKPYSELMGHSINRILSTRYETYFETFEGKYINVEGKLISDPELTTFLSNIDKHSSDICNSISITKNKEIFISGIMTNGCLFPKKEENTFKQIDLRKYLGVEHRAFTDDPNCELHCGIGRYFAVVLIWRRKVFAKHVSSASNLYISSISIVLMFLVQFFLL